MVKCSLQISQIIEECSCDLGHAPQSHLHLPCDYEPRERAKATAGVCDMPSSIYRSLFLNQNILLRRLKYNRYDKEYGNSRQRYQAITRRNLRWTIYDQNSYGSFRHCAICHSGCFCTYKPG